MSDHDSVKGSALLSISEASAVLGVSQPTLRRWTDQGTVRSFVTPGGHRRYSEVELKSLLRGRRTSHQLKELAITLQGTALRQREIAQQYLQSSLWYQRLDESSREYLREQGRRLLSIIIQYVTKPSLRADILQQARQLGGELGGELAKLGLSLTEALEAFVLHRTPVLSAAIELVKKKEPVNKRALAAIAQITYLIDQILLSLVDSFQRPPSEGEKTQ